MSTSQCIDYDVLADVEWKLNSIRKYSISGRIFAFKIFFVSVTDWKVLFFKMNFESEAWNGNCF